MDTVTRDLIRALRGLMATHTQRGDHNPACLQCSNASIAIAHADESDEPAGDKAVGASIDWAAVMDEHPTDAEVDRLIFDLEVFLRERRERAS